MWDTLQMSVMGRFSVRKSVLLFMAVIMASASFVMLLTAPTAFAQSASWSGDSLTHNGQAFTKMQTPPALPGIGNPDQFDLYEYKQGDTAQIIAIPKGSDTTKELTDVKMYSYTIDGTNYTLRGPPNGESITVSAKSNNQQPKTSCAVPSIGWIICGVSKFIAGGMDKIFEIVAGYLEVKPVSGDTESGLFQAWNIARGIANACFIIAFMVIIYSQITSVGINNYEIKKMIPRLIIAAVLVNISYYICAIAVDISNILGDSVHKALIDIRHSLPNPLPDNINYLSWVNLTEYIMSGGAIAGGFFAAKAAFLGSTMTAGTMSALAFLLFPILVSGALAVLIAVLLLAARQALITVLIIASPLAFVAYLLPNTEKWFERWRGLFMTMLLVFPLFSLLFGGAQLASFIIIQNADQLSVIIFAMFIQVAPLFLTPFLIKFSGSLLGKLAGMAQSKQSGLTGRARDWAQERAKVRSAQAMRRVAEGGGANGRYGTYAQRRAYKRQLDKKYREGEIGLGESYVNAGWHNDSRYHKQHRQSHSADAWKEAGEATSNRQFEAYKASEAGRSLQQLSGIKRLEENRVKHYKAVDDEQWAAAEAGEVTENGRYKNFAEGAYSSYRDARISEGAAGRNKAIQSERFSQELKASAELQARAGGIDRLGAIKVKSEASQAVIQAGLKNVEAIKWGDDLSPGDTAGYKLAFDEAIANKDVDSLRAYTDMLAESRDFGIDELRKKIIQHEDAIRGDDYMLEVFRHYVNSNEKINKYAEDIAVWSRDSQNAQGTPWRRLSEVRDAADVWGNMTPENLAKNKASSQKKALMARDASGNWAVTPQQALDIMTSPAAWANVKPKMKRMFRARAMGQLDVEMSRNSEGELVPDLDVKPHKVGPATQHIKLSSIPEKDRDLGVRDDEADEDDE
jgi:hypothetical protein